MLTRLALACAMLLAAACPAAAQQHDQHAMHGDKAVAGVRALYETVRGYTVRAAEQMPEEHYGFKPVDSVRTFGQIVGHVADSQYAFCSAVLGEKNPALQIEGVLLTMFDSRLNLSRQVAEEAKEYFGPKVYETTIPRNVRIAEAPSFGEPIVLYDILSTGAKSYLALAQEVIARGGAERIGGELPLASSAGSES